MAAEKETAAPAMDVTDLGTVIGNAVAQGIAAIAPRREIKEGDPEYVARQRAEGWFDDFFGVTVYQNAYEAEARGLPEAIRRKASQLKAGTYLKGRVTVSVENNGAIVRLSYPVKGDNLTKNLQLWRDFPDLVSQISAEMSPALVPA